MKKFIIIEEFAEFRVEKSYLNFEKVWNEICDTRPNAQPNYCGKNGFISSNDLFNCVDDAFDTLDEALRYLNELEKTKFEARYKRFNVLNCSILSFEFVEDEDGDFEAENFECEVDYLYDNVKKFIEDYNNDDDEEDEEN